MNHGITRRHWLAGVTAAFATACDRLDVDVDPRSGGFATPEGIVPISPIGGFYVYEYRDQPRVDIASWTCTIAIDETVTHELTAAFLDTLTPVEIEHTLQCIGGNPRNTLISNAVWGGLPFEDVLDALGGLDIPQDTVEIIFRGADAYHTSIPLSDLTEERIWLVWEMNGEPLPPEHGAPCRFLVLGRYGTKNVKWPVEIDFTPEPYFGHWESGDWSKDATYQVNGYIFNPLDGTSQTGDVRIFGTAFGGSDPITRVEITFDDGATWTDTQLDYNPGPDRWTLWSYLLTGADGVVDCRIRVTAASGAQTNTWENLTQADGYDGGMRISFRVTP
jgi:DMSO/TMAO reductase YedYZ molybdopterin-dependent catalytic subunit